MTAMPASDDRSLEQARGEAQAHVRALRSFYKSLIAYVLAVPALWVLNLWSTPGLMWAQWPMLGWGIGLAVQGLPLLAGDSWFGPAWERRKVAELMARENLRIVSGEKQAVQAQLRLLQAQIEPHFLFNTLATVRSQIARAPADAERMLEHLIAYLRQSLSASRAEHGTLAEEFARLEHYLALLAIRMGDRLQVRLELDPPLRDEPFAPMLLQPLVENAIRHGLEPKVEGGVLTIAARCEGDGVRITVQDDGLGFGANPDLAGTGYGLTHVRERLALLYDGRARMTVRDAEPGTCITIDLPRLPQAAAQAPRDEGIRVDPPARTLIDTLHPPR